MRLMVIILIMILVGCKNNQNSGEAADNSSSVATGADTVKTETVKTDFTEDSIILIAFPRDSSSISVKGKMTGINHPVTVNISITKGIELDVVLVPEDSIANIRINQLFTPDGKAD